MADEFGTVAGYGSKYPPSYFPTDTDDKLVPVYNDAGRFTGQYQKNARIAVDALLTETTGDLTEIDQTQSALERIESILTTSEGISNAEQLREATAKLAEVSQKLDALKPILIVDIFNMPAPGANTDIVGGGIRMANYPGVTSLLVTVTLTTASVFNYTKSRGALTIFTVGILESVALNAGDGYGPIEIPVSPNDYINFRVETDGIINQLVVYGKRS